MHPEIKLPLGGPVIRYDPAGHLWHVVEWSAKLEIWLPVRIFVFCP